MNPQTSINATYGLFALFIPVFGSAIVGNLIGGDALGDQLLLATAFLAVAVWGVLLNTGRFDPKENGAH